MIRAIYKIYKYYKNFKDIYYIGHNRYKKARKSYKISHLVNNTKDRTKSQYNITSIILTLKNKYTPNTTK